MADDAAGYSLHPVEYDPFVPQSPLAQQVAGFPQRAADLTIGALGPLGEAGMTVGDWMRTGQVDPRDIPQVAGGIMLGTMAPEAEEAAPLAAGAKAMTKGIRAYHGSPYDFDKFSLDKIGTGEGAQAYGHGLYFAESPQVAETYKPGYGFKFVDPEGNEIPKSGHMYEVNINADPEHFLDWDKPLSEQPEAVRTNPGLLEAIQKEAYGRALASTSRTRADELWKMVKDPMSAPAGFAQELLKKPEISEQLRQAGIPGIRYLDQGSREVEPRFTVFDRDGQTVARGLFDKERAQQLAQENGGRFESTRPQQTHNYVVFSPDIINIIRKYGLAGIIGAGAAHFSLSPVDHDPFGGS